MFDKQKDLTVFKIKSGTGSGVKIITLTPDTNWSITPLGIHYFRGDKSEHFIPWTSISNVVQRTDSKAKESNRRYPTAL